MKDLYVVNCCRTAVGSYGGSLKDVPATKLGSIVVKEALKRAGVAPENVFVNYADIPAWGVAGMTFVHLVGGTGEGGPCR